MPPAKRPVNDDSRSEGSTIREKQIAAAAHARNSKKNHQHASHTTQIVNPAKEAPAGNVEAAAVVQQGQGMSWQTFDTKLLDAYRVAYHLSTPAAFTSLQHQALLTNPGIGRQSPTMARPKQERRVPKDQLATAVRKNFNSQGVSETDVVVNLIYRVRNHDKTFKIRPYPGIQKKA